MKNPDVKITIVGGVGTGKSAIAFALKDVLNKNGIASEIIGCEDERPYVMKATYKRRLKALFSKKVLIETIQCKNS